jgi:hypothetical protein
MRGRGDGDFVEDHAGWLEVRVSMESRVRSFSCIIFLSCPPTAFLSSCNLTLPHKRRYRGVSYISHSPSPSVIPTSGIGVSERCHEDNREYTVATKWRRVASDPRAHVRCVQTIRTRTRHDSVCTNTGQYKEHLTIRMQSRYKSSIFRLYHNLSSQVEPVSTACHSVQLCFET